MLQCHICGQMGLHTLFSAKIWMVNPVSALFMWCCRRNLLGGNFTFDPQLWGYCCRTCIHLCVCVWGTETDICISAHDGQAYCLTGWPLNFNVAIELCIYVTGPVSALTCFTIWFLLMSVSCSFANHLAYLFMYAQKRAMSHLSADCFSISSC